MNKELKDLYASKWEEICNMLQDFNEQDPDDDANMATHPLLLKTDKEFEEAELKVMFFGKETNEWNGVFEDDIELTNIFVPEESVDKYKIADQWENYSTIITAII